MTHPTQSARKAAMKAARLAVHAEAQRQYSEFTATGNPAQIHPPVDLNLYDAAAYRAYHTEMMRHERPAIEADALRRAAAAINCGCPAHGRPSRLYTCAYDDCPNQLIGEILALIPDAAKNDGGE